MAKKKLTREEFSWVLDRIMEAAKEPLPEFTFIEDDLDLELGELPEFIPSPPVAVTKSAAPLPPLSGTKAIQIRVPARVIRAFKLEAERTGGQYQTLMNRALKAAADRFV